MTHDEMIAVIEAERNGKQLEVRRTRSAPDAPWWPRGLNAPTFNFSDFEYRVKKEPLVVYSIVNGSNALVSTYLYECAADEALGRLAIIGVVPPYRKVKFVEQL